MDPYYISSTTVPTTEQLEGLKEHIRTMDEEKFVRLEHFVKMKDTILNFYQELESDPCSEFER